jgi:hypothetical protein
MATFVIVGVVSGVLFGVMDALINANPLARGLFKVYGPIARTSLNPVAGIVIDLAYGLVMAGVFVILYESLPGSSGFLKGVSFAVLAWFFRVVMSAASQWMMFRVPGRTLLYTLVTGLGEMLVLGAIYGLTLRPAL